MAKNTYKQDEVIEEPFDIKHLLRASSYIKKYAKRMVFAILLSGIGGASGYVAPMIIQRALDLAIPEKNERLLFSLVGMLVGIYLVSVIFTTIRSRIMVDVSQSIIYDIRKDLFAHLQELPFQYYDDRPHGKILIRVVNYVNSVSQESWRSWAPFRQRRRPASRPSMSWSSKREFCPPPRDPEMQSNTSCRPYRRRYRPVRHRHS